MLILVPDKYGTVPCTAHGTVGFVHIGNKYQQAHQYLVRGEGGGGFNSMKHVTERRVGAGQST